MANGKDLTGMRFGYLTVLSKDESLKYKHQTHTTWLCLCDCGNTTIVRGYCLRNGHTQSCGCLGREKRLKSATKHGQSETRLYAIWHAMKQRCFNPNHKNYVDYGGRGIKVCEEWKNDFQAFYDWAMANGYEESLSIDRINNDGNYEPQNCRWVTMKEQCNNRRPRKNAKLK